MKQKYAKKFDALSSQFADLIKNNINEPVFFSDDEKKFLEDTFQSKYLDGFSFFGYRMAILNFNLKEKHIIVAIEIEKDKRYATGIFYNNENKGIVIKHDEACDRKLGDSVLCEMDLEKCLNFYFDYHHQALIYTSLQYKINSILIQSN